MAYEKHNYASGDVLLASELNEMDDAIGAHDIDIGDLKSDITETASLTGIKWYDGYYDNNNSYVGTPYWKMSNVIPCRAGDTFIYHGVASQENRKVIMFFDKNDSVVSSISNIGTDYTDVTVTVPTNAEFFRCLAQTTGLKKTYIIYGNIATSSPLYVNRKRICNLETSVNIAFVSASTGLDTDNATGTKQAPFKSIGYAISKGFRKICATPELYNENVALTGGIFELIPWVDNQSYSEPYRPKIRLIKGEKLTTSATETTGIVQAQYTAQSDTNIYKVFVDKSITPTTQGTLSLEYNALIVGDMPDTSVEDGAFNPYRRRLYTPVLTESELSVQGTFWYNGNDIIKIHAWDNKPDSEYYIPDDSSDTGLSLVQMTSVNLEDVKVLGCYSNCINILKSDNVKVKACEIGYCAKGMGLKLDYTNARVSDTHAYAISVDGFNLHGYGYSEIIDCTAFYCGDDGISHHEGCSGFIKGGEYGYNTSGGITPSFGCQIDVYDAYTHHNHYGIQWIGTRERSRKAKMSNCLSLDNTKDVYVQWYVVEAWNNVFRTKESPYSNIRSNLIEYGTVTPN